MRKSLLLFALGCLALRASSSEQRAGCINAAVPLGVLDAIRQDSGRTLELRAALVPELSDDLIFLETGGEPAPHKKIRPICFYPVTAAPFTVTNSNELELGSIVVDSNPQWLVAMDDQNSETYLLSGSANPTAGFNRMIASLHLDVTSSAVADNVFGSYLKMARGSDFRSYAVGDDLKLESLALDYFRLNFPRSRSRAAFTAWWASIPAKTKESITPSSAIASKEGFAVRFFFYDQGKLWVETDQIKSNGTVEEGKPESLSEGPPK